jgi:hypothetical protein
MFEWAKTVHAFDPAPNVIGFILFIEKKSSINNGLGTPDFG